MLSYRDHGILLYESHGLREGARQLLPREMHRDFLEEVQDLEELRTSIERQLKVVDRIRWAFARWIG